MNQVTTERWNQLIVAINAEPPRDEVYRNDVLASADLYKRATETVSRELVAALEQWHYQVHGLELDFEKCKDPRCVVANAAKAKNVHF